MRNFGPLAMDKTITIDDVNGQIGRVLKDVESGSTYTITNHGKPVARIVPAPPDRTEAQRLAKDRLLARLAKQRPRNLGPWTRDEGYD
jgi:prevent-host-death family protein